MINRDRMVCYLNVMSLPREFRCCRIVVVSCCQDDDDEGHFLAHGAYDGPFIITATLWQTYKKRWKIIISNG